MFAALTINPSLTEYLYCFLGFGPVTRVAHQRSEILSILAQLDVVEIFTIFGFEDFLPPTKNYILKILFSDFCYECETCCVDVIEAISGPHNAAFNDSRMPVLITHEPGGTSVQNIAHWSQMADSGEFQAFNYGSASENKKHYNSTIPPIYDVTKIPENFSIGLWSGGEDLLADPIDVQTLVKLLGSRVKVWQVLENYAHVDFTWAVSAHYEMYPEVLKFISENVKV